MRLSVTKTGSATSYYVIRSITREGKRSSEVVEKLGTAEAICAKYHCEDALAFAQAYVERLNQNEKEGLHKVLVPFVTNKQIGMDEQNRFNVGYLFLKQVYYGLGLPGLCKRIAARHAFEYDLNEILACLLYGRILYPCSKRSCVEQSRSLLEQPQLQAHQVYRALSVLAEESEALQAQLYKNSTALVKRSTGVLYYDCTNYFFEIEQEEGLKQYGPSKEHRPSPIVQMGLFIDRSGLPLAFNISSGNINEQQTLTPLEKTILQDFNLSKFVVCTDAGLSSTANRRFNNIGNRSFITTQSVKKLKKGLREWVLSTEGWQLSGKKGSFSIAHLQDTEENRERVFYKQQLVEGYDEVREVTFNQTMIVTFSLKYKAYQQHIRQQQIERAQKLIENGCKHFDTAGLNDCKRLILKTTVTAEGEVAHKTLYTINQKVIQSEEQYDGLYAVCTNLEAAPEEIIAINRGRWEIEESFRIMKTDFSARPVYLKRDDRIRAHFLTCFMALLMYRILERRLDQRFTCAQLIQTLREMDMLRIKDIGYAPAYTRTPITDALHKAAGFRTDYELISQKNMKKICSEVKKTL